MREMFGKKHTEDYLRSIGVNNLQPYSYVFDPGYDLVTLENHLEQSHHLMAGLKLSMACWMIAEESISRKKILAAQKHSIPTITGGGPFEIAAFSKRIPEYLDLVADFGFTRIECGSGFTDISLDPHEIVNMANEHGLEVQFELGKKRGGSFTENTLEAIIDQGRIWLNAGVTHLIIEGRENALDVGLFDNKGRLNARFADALVDSFGRKSVVFEAPTKSSQFALLDHFGPKVYLSNIRLEELLRVEIYRRGLHSDAFGNPNLRPKF